MLTTAPNRDTWWTVFHDPVLNKLIVRAYQQNPTVKVACWRIQEARALRSIAVGGLFPQQQTVTADYTRNAVSQTVQNQVHTAPFFDDWSVHAGLAWELDFWGTYRRAVEAADAQLDASIENYHNALVLLLADVATSYVGVRTADLRLKYTNQQLSSQQGILEIARQRFHSGATTELDVTHATSQVEHTKSLIPPLNILRRQAANQLCILLGMPPRDIADLLQGTQPVPSAPPEVAVGIPAELLRQRPDVQQAERQVAAQGAAIGIATSQLYPHLLIVGTIGVDSSEFSQLFESKSLAGSVGPSFRWDVLNYGRLVNGIRVQDWRGSNNSRSNTRTRFCKPTGKPRTPWQGSSRRNNACLRLPRAPRRASAPWSWRSSSTARVSPISTGYIRRRSSSPKKRTRWLSPRGECRCTWFSCTRPLAAAGRWPPTKPAPPVRPTRRTASLYPFHHPSPSDLITRGKADGQSQKPYPSLFPSRQFDGFSGEDGSLYLRGRNDSRS